MGVVRGSGTKSNHEHLHTQSWWHVLVQKDRKTFHHITVHFYPSFTFIPKTDHPALLSSRQSEPVHTRKYTWVFPPVILHHNWKYHQVQHHSLLRGFSFICLFVSVHLPLRWGRGRPWQWERNLLRCTLPHLRRKYSCTRTRDNSTQHSNKQASSQKAMKEVLGDSEDKNSYFMPTGRKSCEYMAINLIKCFDKTENCLMLQVIHF